MKTLYWCNCLIFKLFFLKLHAKFDQIKEENGKEKKKLEDYQKQLDDEIAEFQRLRMQFQTQQLSGSHHTLSLGTLGKGKKK